MAGKSFVELLLREFAKKIVEDTTKHLDVRKDATGNLRNSIVYRFKIMGNTYETSILMEDYWKYVDEGRRPGTMPPVEPILQWVRVKRAQRLGKKKKLTPSSERSLAFAIARSIKKKGIKPTYFFSDVVNDGRMEALKKTLQKSLKKDVEIELRKK